MNWNKSMPKVLIENLSTIQMDYLVAKIQNNSDDDFHPSTNVEQCDQIVLKERMQVEHHPNGVFHDGKTFWSARTNWNYGGLFGDTGYGATKEAAVMRSYIKRMLSNRTCFVEVPEELV